MGLIQAAMGAVGGVLADQWKEFFYCESLSADILVAKGQKRTSSQGRSSNTSAEDNIISNGSGIAVNDGQCMIIVESGEVVEVCAQPGQYTYDQSTEPSVFSGDLGESIIASFKQMGRRFTFGGDPGKDQRVYYFNTKEIIGNKYGTPTPISFRVVDQGAGIDADFDIKCFGEYSYHIVDPILFYKKVCGNVESEYSRKEIDSQLKSELLTALQPAFAKISVLGARPSQLIGYTKEIANALKEELSQDWTQGRGIEVVKFGISNISMTDEDKQRLKDMQVVRDANTAGRAIAAATAGAMRDAAKNEGGMGAMGAFMGMGMAGNMGGANASNLFAMGQQQQMMQQQMQPQQQAAPAAAGWTCTCGQGGNTGKFCTACGKPQPAPADAWTCSCGQGGNTGKFCTACGKPKPEGGDGWKCSCGAVNQGNFCQGCGAKRPAGEPLYKCDKCGWNPPDPKNPPKFCPQCGDPFDDADKV
jgi:membrane protease subunit (stomatin/prohibitin family)